MRKLLSLLLTLALCIGMMPAMAFAETETPTSGSGTEAEPWVVYNWDALKEKMAAGGYIQLGENVTDPTKSSSSYLSVPSGATVTLDLNGHKIDRGLTSGTAIENGYVILAQGSLTVTDSSTDKTGMITGGNNSYNGGGVYVGSDGTLDHKGGTISGNKVAGEYGGGVYVASGGTFTMSGSATISDNSVTNSSNGYGNGGGVYVSGTCNMTGGTIANNSASGAGGGVMIVGKFNMSGGSITGNKASRGGGVWLNYGRMSLTGGSITENTADAECGGVVITTQTTFNLSGNPIVTGNTIGSSKSNLWLGGAGGSSYYSDPMINVTGALTEGASIGVTLGEGRSTRQFTDGFGENNPDTKPAAFFISDDSNYYVGDAEEGVLSRVTTYPLWVAGTQVTSANAGDLSVIDGVTVGEDGYAKYISTNNTLTIKNATITNSMAGDYGFGIQYTGTGTTFTLEAAGTNTVSMTGKQTQSSAAVAVGTPGVWETSTPEANLRVYLLSDATLNLTGGTAEGGNYPSSYGIVNAYDGQVVVTGAGTVNATGGTASYSYGVSSLGDFYKTGACTLNATGADCYWSTGIAANGDIVLSTGVVNAVGGTSSESGAKSYGIFGDSYDDDQIIVTDNVEVLAKGNTSALNMAPTLNSGVTAGGSVNYDGTDAAAYVAADNNTYKWFQAPFTVPVTTYPLYIAGTQVTGDNATDILGDGTVSYDPDSNTLTLNNAIITGGSENTSNYGWGICYRGNDDFQIVANGTNIVQDANSRLYASYGIIIGEPSPVTYSTDAVNVTITVADGATLVAAGGKVNSHSENYEGIWGIYNEGSGSLTVNGGGTLIANASNDDSNNIRKTMGLVAQDITIDGSCTVNAVAGNSNMSVGILCGNFTLPESFTGTVNATSGDAPGTSDNYATYGIRATGDVSIGGGTVTASTGARTGNNTAGDYAVGIFGENSLSITGGTVMAFGDGVGLWCYQGTTSINKADVTAIGYNIAVNGLDLTSVTAEASTETGGTDLVEYDDSAYSTYKYVHTTPVTSNKVAEPVLPRATTFTDSMTIEITCETEDAEIYYTTGSAITLYTAPFVITETTTVEAHATKAGFEDSDVVTSTYTKTTPSSGGGGGTTTYPVKPASTENGNITVAPRNAAEKSTVTVTVTPDEGYVLDKLTVKDKDGKEIAVKDNGDGTYTFTMPASAIEIEATFKPEEETPAADGFPFVDVPENSYFRKPVEWAVEKCITNGISEDKYGPEMSCTRAQVVTFLWITCGSEDAGIETGFDDVDVAAYYDKAVAWAVEKGITAGTSENEFSPEMTITRAQFVTMLWAAKGMPEAAGEMPFKDVPADAYYAKAVAWAYANDITAGKSADSFASDDPCTRAQIMTFLYNAYEE